MLTQDISCIKLSTFKIYIILAKNNIHTFTNFSVDRLCRTYNNILINFIQMLNRWESLKCQLDQITCSWVARGDPTTSSSRPSPFRSTAAKDDPKYSPNCNPERV